MSFNTKLDDAKIASFLEKLNDMVISLAKDLKKEDEVNVQVTDATTPPPSHIALDILAPLDESEEEEDEDERWEEIQRAARAMDEIDDMKRSGAYWNDFDYNNYDYDRLDDRYNGNNDIETGLDWNESGYFD